MKKLLLLMTLMFAVVTITFANKKITKTKKVIKKELFQKKQTTIDKTQEEDDAASRCVFIFYVNRWDGEQFGPTEIDVIIDLDCIRRNLPPGFYI